MNKQIFIGEAKTTYVKSQTSKQDAPQIRGSKDAHKMLLPFYEDEADREAFCVIFLNRAHKVLFIEKMFTGGITGCTIDVRLILKKALINGATSLIISHNHPSGNLQPSESDKRMTKKLNESAKIMDITLLDHLIMADDDLYYSFGDEGRI